MHTSSGSGFRPVLQGELDVDYGDNWTRYDPDLADDHETGGPTQHFLAPEGNHASPLDRSSTGTLRTAFYGNEENENDTFTGAPDAFRTRHIAYRDTRTITNWRPSNLNRIEGRQNVYETDEEEWGAYHKSTQGFVSDDNRVPNYKPPVFRLWFLGILLLILLATLAMMELAVHLLPDGTKDAKPVAIVKNETNLRAREVLSEPIIPSDTSKWNQGPFTIHDRRQAEISDSTIELATKDEATFKGIEESSTPLSFGSAGTSTTLRVLDTETTLSTVILTDISQESITAETSSATTSPVSESETQASTTAFSTDTVSSSTPSRAELITCTVTETLGMDSGLKTITVPTVTVTVGGDSSGMDEGSTDIPSSIPSTDSASLTSSSCDVVVTLTVIHTPTMSSQSDTGGYITVGENTVTITLPGPGENGNKDSPPVSEPTSTCYRRTVTVTNKADLEEITKTVTVHVTILPGGVAIRDATLPTADIQSAQLEARDCIDGGVLSITEYVAKPKTVTVKVYRTVTKASRPSIASSLIPTTNRQKPTSIKTLPLNTIHDTEISLPPDGVTRTVQAILTDADGNLIISTITGTHEATRGHITTQPPLHSTDADGDIIVNMSETSYTSSDLDSTGFTTEPNLSTKFTMIPTTLKDSNGHPTLTTSIPVFLVPTSTALTDSHGKTTSIEEFYILNYPHTTTFIDFEGRLNSTATYYLLTSSMVLTDKNGKPTKTSVITYTKTVSTRTAANDVGKPTTTEVLLVSASFQTPDKPTSPPPKPTDDTDSKNVTVFEIYSITQFEYFAGLMLPTIISTALTIPFRVLDHVAQLYHPFHVLASSHRGAKAAHSICWETAGLWTFIARFQCFFQGKVLIAITGMLVLLSASLVPVSAETIRVILQGKECQPGQGNPENCAITVGAFPVPARIAMGLLGLLAIFTIMAAAVLWRYRTGVATKPWSLSAIAGLSSNPKMQLLLSQIPRRYDGQVGKEEALWVLSTQVYTLDFWQDDQERRYGVIPVDPMDGSNSFRSHEGASVHPGAHWSGRKSTPFYVLTFWGRALVLFILIGMLAVIITFNAMSRDTLLGQFLSSESVALRVFITSIGMIITLFWSSYFSCK